MKHTLQIVGSRVYSEGIHPRVNPFGVYESATCTRGIIDEQIASRGLKLICDKRDADGLGPSAARVTSR